MAKKILAVLILITSAGLAGLTVKNSNWTPAVFGLNDYNGQILTEPTAGILSPGNQSNKGKNLTNLLIDYLGQQIKSANPNLKLANLNDLSTVKNPDEKIIAQWLDKNIPQLTTAELKPEIPDQSLKTTADQNEAAVIAYLNQLQQILQRNFENSPQINFAPETITSADLIIILEQIISQYNQALNELYNLITPQNLLTFHKEEIKLITARRNLYKIMIDFPNDPLKTLLVNPLEKQITQEFNALLNQLLKILDQNNFKP